MIKYNGMVFFVSPKGFRKGDIEFNVINSKGQIIGTNFTGLKQNVFHKDADRISFEEMILIETTKMETEIKFIEMFKVDISCWRALNLSKSEIIDIMDAEWNVSPENIATFLV